MKQKSAFQKLTISILVIFGLAFFISNVQAAEISSPKQKKTDTVATTGIDNAKIVSQDKNQLKVTFGLSNRANVQPDVKYAVQLIKKDKGGQVVVDEQIYPEIVNLGENETISKEINYIAPAYFSGNFQLWLVAKNQNGLLLAMVHPGDVVLSGDGQYAEIDVNSCFMIVTGEVSGRQYALGQGVDIKDTERLTATCEITNHSKTTLTVTPKAETHWRTTFGRVVPDNQEPQKVLVLNPQEKKQVSFTLPKATVPQAYDIIVNLSDANGNVISNKAIFHYVLRGASATIQNLRLDKDYYQKGDAAKASFFWTPSADSFSGSRFGATDGGKLFAIISIKDKNNTNCVAINSKKELDSKERTPSFDFPVIADCLDPQISVAIQDAKGLILDQSDYRLTSKGESVNTTIKQEQKKENQKNNLLFYGISFIFLLSIISFAVILIKKRHINTFLLLILVASGLLVSSGVWAAGATFVVDFNYIGAITYNVNLDKTVYKPNEAIIATGNAYSSTCSNTTMGITLEAEINETSYSLLSNGTSIVGQSSTSTATVVGVAQSVPGVYRAHFSGSVYYGDISSGQADIEYEVAVAPVCNAFSFDNSSYVKDAWGSLSWTTTGADDCALSCTGLDPEFSGSIVNKQYTNYGMMLNREGLVNCSLLPRKGAVVGEPCYASTTVGPAASYSCTGTPPDPIGEFQEVCPSTKTSGLPNVTLWKDVTATGCTGAVGACEYYTQTPVCNSFSFSSASYSKDTWGPLSWTTTKAKGCTLSCNGLTPPVLGLNVPSEYTNFGVLLNENGTVNCLLTPYNGAVTGTPCVTSASVCAATCQPIGTDMRACADPISAADEAMYKVKTVTDGSTCCGAQKCYSCADGYIWDGGAGACVLNTATCTNPPSNADLCADDDYFLAANIDGVVVDVCSSPVGSEPKCEYTCKVGFTRSGNSCVADCVPGVCTTGCSNPCGVGVCGTQPRICASCPANTCDSAYCGPCGSGLWEEK
ncbi:MAG: hypothetical protein WAV73_06020 [Candidatus Moraniibacteriota bacterium]